MLIPIPRSTEDCTCCAGSVEGDLDELCPGCLHAVLQRDRDAHPHPRSFAQEVLYQQSRTGGGIVAKTITPIPEYRGES